MRPPREKLPASIEAANAIEPRAHTAPDEAITAERIEHAMVLLAYMIANGQAAPETVRLLDRLERELAIYKTERDPVSRARRQHVAGDPIGIAHRGGAVCGGGAPGGTDRCL